MGGGERPGSYKLGDYVVGAKAVGADVTDVPELMRDLLEDVNSYLSDNGRALIVAPSSTPHSLTFTRFLTVTGEWLVCL